MVRDGEDLMRKNEIGTGSDEMSESQTRGGTAWDGLHTAECRSSALRQSDSFRKIPEAACSSRPRLDVSRHILVRTEGK
jgi:hypothetical protein